ncbi:ATP-binding cassette domain-containing protein [Rhodococcus hoagii]|nr:ATP-binding cassette domain-containing protein [Prescottella equi]NKZ88261.1 ATP-binding cassette domain-containing protein [Prescottella equi]
MTGQTLTFDGIAKRYGDVVALESLSFDVRPGEIFGFVGSNGAGKTTAMRSPLGVLAADRGEVLSVQARGPRGPPLDRLHARGARPVSEDEVGRQLTYLAELHGLSRAEAADAASRWTERLGIAARVNDAVDALSLGNQQRVQLAAALVHDPAV